VYYQENKGDWLFVCAYDNWALEAGNPPETRIDTGPGCARSTVVHLHPENPGLSRKRPSPLAGGRVATWACGILYALGTVNFLFDATQNPHLRGEDLARLYGVAPSTAANQGRKVRDLLGMYPGDPNWCLPSFMDANPLVWMLSINGFIMDIRDAPREVQQMAYEEGLIPYVPGERG